MKPQRYEILQKVGLLLLLILLFIKGDGGCILMLSGLEINARTLAKCQFS